MPESIRIAVNEQSQTAEARRAACELAGRMGFDAERTGQIAIVVTEACTNLLNHADGGEILLRIADDEEDLPPELEILALDRGPGMANLEQCLRDGFSTGGSLGQGLGAISRLSAGSDFYSQVSRGTALLARWIGAARDSNGTTRATNPRVGRIRVGAINVCKPGQEVCGDSWGVLQTEDHCVLLVADGLGHGLEAKTASIEAVRMLHMSPDLSPGALVERVHEALRSSRGAAVAVILIDTAEHTVTFAGVGNISAQIYAGARPIQHLVSVNGTAGHQTSRIREFNYPWPENGMLVAHSDGLTTGTSLETLPGLTLRDPTLIAGVLYRDFARNNDDATVVVAKAA